MTVSGHCFVYVIATLRDGVPSSPVKFGISAQPFARMRELQTGSALPLIILGMLAAPTRTAARDAEQWLHSCYPDKALAGEWFDIDAWEAVEILGHFVSDRLGETAGRGSLVAAPPGETLQ
jgi:hypothetical protein